jgi:hypothetical protein
MLLWVNLHAGFALGLALISPFCCVAGLEMGNEKKLNHY